MSYLHLVLRAVEPKANVNRAYEVYLAQGLFDNWAVTLAYGRYDRGEGTQKNYSFESLKEAKGFINKTLKKRSQAEKRINCRYQLTKKKLSKDFVDDYSYF